MRRYYFVMLLLMILVSPALTVYGQSDSMEQMKVHFIDVGQGDSMLIQTPNGKNILIDGGPPDAGKTVVQFLKKHDVDQLDLLIATHPDMDHIGGLPAVMKEFTVKQILDSGKLHATRAYVRYISQIRKHNIPVDIAQQDEKLQVDPDVVIRILNTYTRHSNNNQSSIVLKVIYKKVTILLMGDLERELEKGLIDKYDMHADILKVAHHGSKTSTSSQFLKEISPKDAIISYGKQNDYGHPVKRVIRNLNEAGANIFSTAVFGDITALTDGENYYLLTERTPMDGIIETAG